MSSAREETGFTVIKLNRVSEFYRGLPGCYLARRLPAEWTGYIIHKADIEIPRTSPPFPDGAYPFTTTWQMIPDLRSVFYTGFHFDELKNSCDQEKVFEVLKHVVDQVT